MTGLQMMRLPILLAVLAGLAAAPVAVAQNAPTVSGLTEVPGSEVPTFVINLRDADLRALAEQVSEITGRTLILDAAVAGNVTVISAAPLNKDGVWDLFQSVLAVQGFAAVPSGNLWRVVTQQAAKESGGGGSAMEATTRLDVITRLVPLENFPATTAVLALRPLVAASGYLEAVPETNTLIITDTAENVGRIENIARSLDLGSGKQVYTLAIRNGDATEIAMAVQNILGDAAGTAGSRVTVDQRSNVLIFNGDAKTYEMVRGLVVDLDIPGRPVASSVPVTRVYALKFADAVSMAEVLRGLVSGGTLLTNPVAEALQPETVVLDKAGQPVSSALAPPPVTSFASEDITIQPVLESNSVVVRARAEVQADLAALIAELDQRRPQVLIEAAIVEVSGDISEQIGVQLGLGAATPPGGFAATSFSTTGPSLQNILTLLGSPVAASVGAGLSIGLSRQDQFGLMLQAFGQSSKANLLSTPSITTLDNQPAEIVVGQNVPFRTGTSAPDGNTPPFTTIERRDVGITMRVTPRVNQGDVVQLEISQEVSSLLNTTVAGAADLITNRRSIKTTVLADNGGTIVLGGLITDDRQSTRAQVPGLGNLPIVGGLFRNRNESARRQTLFIFLRPTILRGRDDVARAAKGSFLRLKSIETDATGERGSILDEPRPVRNLPVEIDGLY